MPRLLPTLGALALAGLLLAPPAPVGSAGPGSQPFPGAVELTPVTLSRPQDAAGRVSVRLALRLTGGSSFGGLSALRVAEGAGGARLVAVADIGTVLRLDGITPAGASRPARWLPLPPAARDGRGKAGRDSESLAFAGGQWWIGFENRNELRRYSPDLTQLTGRYRSDAMAELAASSGLEALAALPGGRLLGLAEEKHGDGRSPAFLWQLDDRGRIASQTTLWARLPDGLRATDAVWLDGREGGRLLVLARGFNLPEGFHTALLLMPLSPSPGFGGQELTGRILARFGPDWDNLEGLSVTKAGGRTTAWLVSDDNLSALQRTLLVGLWLTVPN